MSKYFTMDDLDAIKNVLDERIPPGTAKIDTFLLASMHLAETLLKVGCTDILAAHEALANSILQDSFAKMPTNPKLLN